MSLYKKNMHILVIETPEKLYAVVHDFSQEINSDEYVRDNLEKLI